MEPYWVPQLPLWAPLVFKKYYLSLHVSHSGPLCALPCDVEFALFASVYYYFCKLVCAMVKCVSTFANMVTLEFALFATVFYYFCKLVLRRHQKRVLGVPN